MHVSRKYVINNHTSRSRGPGACSPAAASVLHNKAECPHSPLQSVLVTLGEMFEASWVSAACSLGVTVDSSIADA